MESEHPHYLVKSVMKKQDVLTIGEFETIAKAVTMLEENGISALPVTDPIGNYCGVFTKSDLARKKLINAFRAYESPDKLFVKHFMNKTSPYLIDESASLGDAIDLLHRHEIHRLFVTNQDGKICGVLSTTDIIKWLHVDKQYLKL